MGGTLRTNTIKKIFQSYLRPVSLHPPDGTDLSLERDKLIPDQVYRPAQPPAANEAMLSGVTEPWEGTADWFTGLIGFSGLIGSSGGQREPGGLGDSSHLLLNDSPGMCGSGPTDQAVHELIRHCRHRFSESTLLEPEP